MKTILVLLSAVLLANHVHAASIIFPGEEVEAEVTEPPSVEFAPRQTLVFTEIPECARNNTAGICSSQDAHEYPTELIRSALANADAAALSEIIRGDESTLALADRFGGSVHDDNNLVDETAACAASEEIIFPTMAQNDKKEWLYVANVDSLSQGIRVEKCLDEGRPCKIGELFTVCKQKYIYRKMLAMDANQKLEADNFRIPSTCACYVKKLTTRFRDSTAEKPSTRDKRQNRRRSRSRRQTNSVGGTELDFIGGETEGLSGSPLDNSLTRTTSAQGTAQQSIETEDTLNPSDTIGQQAVRYAGEIVVESNPIVVQKKPPKSAGARRN